jgi:hypothetical protein
MPTLNHLLMEHFRCPDPGLSLESRASGESRAGFFRFGGDVVCYGQLGGASTSPEGREPLHDALADVRLESSRCVFPFDPVAAVENLRRERYAGNAAHNGNGRGSGSLLRKAYYGVRPFLPVPVRRHLQRLFLAGRRKTPFPSWPLDRTADRLLDGFLALCLRAQGRERIPFIWFWPEGCSSAAIVTHDVETAAGVAACPALMDLDDQFGIRSSFQLVPEERYLVPKKLLGELRRRGFEINVHDLNHDGRLYWERQEFLRRAEKINQHGREFGARGFRAAVLYRNLDWYDALEFSYDMSVPNVGHLDPQPGGCCTVMPYFVGGILELPVTTTQDYPLFHILGEYSTALWTRQIDLIRAGNGLISFIAHPDYLGEPRARQTYSALLAHLARLRSDAGLWIALPGEVNDWWRARSRMRLVEENGAWRIEGPEKDRARIAFASPTETGICYTVQASEIRTAARCVSSGF